MSYISRFILCTGLLSGVLFSGGCRKGDFREVQFLPEDTALVDAMLILHCNDMQTKAETREEQEKQINDLNLFFVHQFYPSVENPEVRHYYFSSVDMAKHIKLANIRLGKYRLYAVANAGQKLCSDSHDPLQPDAVGESFCSLTEEEIKNLDVRFSQSPTSATKLLMVGENPETEIKRADEILPTVQINLVRKVAKYDFSYRLVGPAVGKMKVKKIEVKSVPSRLSAFQANRLSGTSYNSWTILNAGNNGQLYDEQPYETCFYLPENMQGDVPGLQQEDRHVKNAPEYSTYLYIDGEYENSQYGISLYMGDDMTGGNFDIPGNAHYLLNIEQGGPNLSDARISSMKLEIHSEGPYETFVNEWIDLLVKITCTNYFNDNLTLNCNIANPNIGEAGGEFEVYLSDSSGRQDEPINNIGNFRYNILSTGDDGKGEIWCLVKYRQANPWGQVRISLTIQSRLGTAYFEDQVYDFKN